MKMNRKLKIAFTGNSARTMLNFRLGVMSAFVRDGYEVTMITPPDCDTDICRQRGIGFIPISVDCKGTNPITDLRLLEQLTDIYRREQFDFAFHYTIKAFIYGSMAAKRCGLKQISVVTGLGYTFIRRNWLFMLSRIMHRIALKEACQVWFLNQDDLNDFVSNRIVPLQKTHLIHGEGVDTSHFAASVLPEGRFRFLYAGRMLFSKGVKLFVDAARELKAEYPDCEWALLGALDAQNPDAVSPETMEQWVQHGIVTYLGVTTDVRPYIQQCTCIVLPSYYREGVPRVLMEGASMARPLITTDSVGCRDVVDDGVNGLLCLPRDKDSLVTAMRKMLSMSYEELKVMGEAGCRKVSTCFDERLIINEYKQACEKYIDHV